MSWLLLMWPKPANCDELAFVDVAKASSLRWTGFCWHVNSQLLAMRWLLLTWKKPAACDGPSFLEMLRVLFGTLQFSLLPLKHTVWFCVFLFLNSFIWFWLSRAVFRQTSSWMNIPSCRDLRLWSALRMLLRSCSEGNVAMMWLGVKLNPLAVRRGSPTGKASVELQCAPVCLMILLTQTGNCFWISSALFLK